MHARGGHVRQTNRDAYAAVERGSAGHATENIAVIQLGKHQPRKGCVPANSHDGPRATANVQRLMFS